VAYKLIVVAGDSNAVGYGPTDYTPGPVGGVYIFGGTYWGGYVPGVNSGTTNLPAAWGPEYEIANRFHAENPDDVLLIVKSAKGSTPLAADPNVLDWSVASQGEMFDLTTAKIDAARAEFARIFGEAPEVSAVFFVSGPNDSYDLARADAYEHGLTNLFTAIRAEWMHDENGYIGFNRMTEAGPYNQTVRVAQWSVDQADANAESFKTIGFGMQADGIHYDTAGRVALGDAFYNNWIA
jgi:hypothetical protein